MEVRDDIPTGMSDHRERNVVHRELETGSENAAVQVAEIVAELDDKQPQELATTYECLDHVIDNIFSNPPSPEADLQVTFSYEGYRVTVEQDGMARFAELE